MKFAWMSDYAAMLKHDYEKRGLNTYIKDLENEAEEAFVRAKAKLGVKEFYVDGLVQSSSWGYSKAKVAVRKGMKIAFVSNSNKKECMIDKTPFKLNEALVIRRETAGKDKLKLQKVSGGKKVKVDFELVSKCSVVELY